MNEKLAGVNRRPHLSSSSDLAGRTTSLEKSISNEGSQRARLRTFKPIARLSVGSADLMRGKWAIVFLINSCLLRGASETLRNAIAVAQASYTCASIGIPPLVLPKS